MGGYKNLKKKKKKPDIIRIVCYKPTVIGAPTKNCPLVSVKSVFNWAKCMFAEHAPDCLTNYDSFLN